MDDRKDRAASCLFREALIVGVRAGAATIGHFFRPRSRGEVPYRSARPSRPDECGPYRQRPRRRRCRRCEEATGNARGRGLIRAKPARPSRWQCGDDDPCDRADGRRAHRPSEYHQSFLQWRAGGQDLRVRGVRAGQPGESRAARDGYRKSAVHSRTRAGEGGQRPVFGIVEPPIGRTSHPLS